MVEILEIYLRNLFFKTKQVGDDVYEEKRSVRPLIRIQRRKNLAQQMNRKFFLCTFKYQKFDKFCDESYHTNNNNDNENELKYDFSHIKTLSMYQTIKILFNFFVLFLIFEQLLQVII